MIDISGIDYSSFDRSEILMFLFYPRSEGLGTVAPEGSDRDLLIPVEKDVVVGMRMHIKGPSSPSILFFHGNGEIVADYDDLGLLYNSRGINFFPADYRGYGRSSGRPTVTAMMRDCHVILDYLLKWLTDHGHKGPLIVMGRSLGSASALELAAHYSDQIDGLIIESGFARIDLLLDLLGVGLEAQGTGEEQGFHHPEKISAFEKPTLIIHAEHDHIIPFKEGQALFEASRAKEKHFLMIPGANHNDIFLRGMKEYMEAVKTLADGLDR